MTRTTLGLLAFLLASAAASAQSVYVDFGSATSPWGVPPATYGGAAAPGVWNAVASSPATGLLDVTGAATGVSLVSSSVPMLDACGHASTTGADESLYDDRWFFDPVAVTLTVSGLQPGTYRVHLHALVAPCVDMFSPLTVAISTATPASDSISAIGWSGAPAAGQNYTVQYKTIASGDDIVLQISAPSGFTSFTQYCGLQLVRVPGPEPFCSGDGSATVCPCGNAGAPGRGCENSFTTGGARLRMTFGGLASVAHDSVELSVSGTPPTSSGLYFQGTSPIAGGLGSAFGDGLRCVGGSIVRLGTKVSSGGSSAYPEPGDPSVSARGLVPATGGTRNYQVWYRNAAAYCTASTFNLSNGLTLEWGP